MTALYQDPEGYLGLQISATYEAATAFRTGKRTLIHMPVEYVDELCEGHRPLQVGDRIGLHSNPVRVAMSTIVKIERIHLQDTTESDLVLLGRTEEDMDAYRKSWERIWNDQVLGLRYQEQRWPWDTNPEVYAITWKPLQLKPGLV